LLVREAIGVDCSEGSEDRGDLLARPHGWCAPLLWTSGAHRPGSVA
jgi:hypothetical protein